MQIGQHKSKNKHSDLLFTVVKNNKLSTNMYNFSAGREFKLKNECNYFIWSNE